MNSDSNLYKKFLKLLRLDYEDGTYFYLSIIIGFVGSILIWIYSLIERLIKFSNILFFMSNLDIASLINDRNANLITFSIVTGSFIALKTSKVVNNNGEGSDFFKNVLRAILAYTKICAFLFLIAALVSLLYWIFY